MVYFILQSLFVLTEYDDEIKSYHTSGKMYDVVYNIIKRKYFVIPVVEHWPEQEIAHGSTKWE